MLSKLTAHNSNTIQQVCPRCHWSGHKPPFCAGVNYTFYWFDDHNAKQVYLYGSFPQSKWQIPIKMQEHDILTRDIKQAIQVVSDKNSIENANKIKKFSKVINLPVGRHSYKFKVDNRWALYTFRPIQHNGYGGCVITTHVIYTVAQNDTSFRSESLAQIEEEFKQPEKKIEVEIDVPSSLHQFEQVALLGSWNEWQGPGIPVFKSDIKISLSLEGGRYYYYKFKINKMEWYLDSDVKSSKNHHGFQNNYIFVHSRPQLSKRSSSLNQKVKILERAVTRMTWHKSPHKFKSYQGQSITRLGGQIIAFGGLLSSWNKVMNTVYRIDPTTFYCSIIESQGEQPPPRAYHQAVAFGERTKLIIFGGLLSDHQYSNDVYTLIPANGYVWTHPKCKGSPPSKVIDFSMSHVIIQNSPKIVIFGGCDREQKVSNDTFVLNLDNMQWENLKFEKSPLPQKRAGHSQTVIPNQGKIIIFGGYFIAINQFLDIQTFRHYHYYNDMWILDLYKLQWTQVVYNRSIFPSPRSCGSLFKIESIDKLFLFGGQIENEIYNDTYIFDLNLNSWSKPQIQGKVPPARQYAQTIFVNTEIILLGGKSQFQKYSQEIYILCLDGVQPLFLHFVNSSQQQGDMDQINTTAELFQIQ